MPKLIDIVGQRFGRLVVIQRKDNDKRGNHRWLCECDCGKEKIVLGYSLRSGRTQSCGCLQKEITAERSTKHGNAKRGQLTKIYEPWAHMIQRCTNPNNKKYKCYGGRGIAVCKRWWKFENFLQDMPGWKLGLTIERKNNNKGYCKSNCKWGTRKEQARNTRSNRLITFNNKTQCIAVWAEELNINYHTLWWRLFRREWSIEKALATPVKKKSS